MAHIGYHGYLIGRFCIFDNVKIQKLSKPPEIFSSNNSKSESNNSEFLQYIIIL